MDRRCRAALAFASLIAGCHGHGKPCDGAAGVAMSARWQAIGVDLPAGAVVCESSSTKLVVEAPGNDLSDLETRATKALQSKHFDLDAQRTAVAVGSTLFHVGLHQQALGIEVTLRDMDPVRSGVRQLELALYPACVPEQGGDGDPGTLQDNVETLLAGPSDDGYCAALRYHLPPTSGLPSDAQRDKAYVATYEAFELEPTALLDALAAARAEGRKDVKVRSPTSFDDPAFDGVRARLSSILEHPPRVVEVSGKVLGYVASESGMPDFGGAWIAPLDAIKIAEAPSPRSKRAASPR